MKIISKIILIIIFIVVIITALITVIFSIQKKSGKIPYIFGYSYFTVTGTSMYPILDVGDLIIIKKMDSYQIGDIITFINSENYITTHKIIGKDSNMYQTKGESNNFIDGTLVSEDNIYGKVIYTISNFDKVLIFLKKYIYYIISGVIVLSIIVVILYKKRNHAS